MAAVAGSREADQAVRGAQLSSQLVSPATSWRRRSDGNRRSQATSQATPTLQGGQRRGLRPLRQDFFALHMGRGIRGRQRAKPEQHSPRRICRCVPDQAVAARNRCFQVRRSDVWGQVTVRPKGRRPKRLRAFAPDTGFVEMSAAACKGEVPRKPNSVLDTGEESACEPECETQRARWWQTILDHYGRRCACCGERHVKFLTVDHRHGLGRSTLSGGRKSWRKGPGAGYRRRACHRPPWRCASVLVWRFVSTKHPIPEEMDHCEIAVGVPMMNEV
jgi:hypothetical protein